MPSYSNPNFVTYTRSIGTSDAAWAVSAPPGCTKARLVDIQVSATTTFNAVTTSAKVGVGVTGNTSVLGLLTIGTTAAGSAVGLRTQVSRVGTLNPTSWTIDLTGTTNTIPSGTKIPEVSGPLLITYTAMTGGSPAGAGILDVTLGWF